MGYNDCGLEGLTDRSRWPSRRGSFRRGCRRERASEVCDLPPQHSGLCCSALRNAV